MASPRGRSRPRTGYLGWTVFAAGFCTMAAEMAAPRLLAPYFGTTQLVWASVIGTILAALAIGSFVGGRLADRWPSRRHYGAVLVGAGLFLAAIPLASRPILERAAAALAHFEMGTFLLSLGAVALFFAPPVAFLGAVTPWAIRIAGAGRTDLGRIAGVLAGLGALGSILGTFSAALIALPLWGTRATLFALGGVLVVSGASSGRWSLRDSLSALVALGLTGWGVPGPIRSDAGVLYEDDGPYQYVWVRGLADGPKELLVNEGSGAQSVTLPPEGSAGGVWDVLALTASLVIEPEEVARVLIIGLAGGTVAAQLERSFGERVRIDGVEIDPAILTAGERFLGLGQLRRLETHVADGRVALRKLVGPYDLIVIDVFRGSYIPFHLTTVEFLRACQAKLAPGGLIAMNIAAGRSSTALPDAMAATAAVVFYSVGLLDVPVGLSPVVNRVLVAGGESLRRDARSAFVPWLAREELAGLAPFTDDRAPVELYTDLSLLGLVSPAPGLRPARAP